MRVAGIFWHRLGDELRLPAFAVGGTIIRRAIWLATTLPKRWRMIYRQQSSAAAVPAEVMMLPSST
jgi:hypothetical protein